VLGFWEKREAAGRIDRAIRRAWETKSFPQTCAARQHIAHRRIPDFFDDGIASGVGRRRVGDGKHLK
jgi:hypothetical protein